MKINTNKLARKINFTYICPHIKNRFQEKHLLLVKNAYNFTLMVKNTYFDFMLDNLGYTFENNITLLKVRKDILHNLYMDSPNDLRLLTKGAHGQYRKKKKEDFDLMTYNNTEVPVCTRKFSTDHSVVRLVDRSVEELKTEAKRIYEVLKENGKL